MPALYVCIDRPESADLDHFGSNRKVYCFMFYVSLVVLVIMHGLLSCKRFSAGNKNENCDVRYKNEAFNCTRAMLVSG